MKQKTKIEQKKVFNAIAQVNLNKHQFVIRPYRHAPVYRNTTPATTAQNMACGPTAARDKTQFLR